MVRKCKRLQRKIGRRSRAHTKERNSKYENRERGEGRTARGRKQRRPHRRESTGKERETEDRVVRKEKS